MKELTLLNFSEVYPDAPVLGQGAQVLDMQLLRS